MKPFFPSLVCMVLIGLWEVGNVFAASPLSSLERIDAFAFGGVGAAGIPSEGEIEFRALLASPDAARDFRKLLASGNREAKCYALVALRKLDPKGFPALAAPFAKVAKPVKTIGGCMIMDQPMKSVVAGIVKGNYDLYLDRKLQP